MLQKKELSVTIIISIYKDVEALNVILYTLANQSYRDFSIIVSEDGKSPMVAEYIESVKEGFSNLKHLTQPDNGFMKNKALNRAILASESDYLIFIDGDCVPHYRFIESHLRFAQQGSICCGRRVELGKEISKRIRKKPEYISRFFSITYYLKNFQVMKQDGVKNYEYGLYLPLITMFTRQKTLNIVGCNFSCFKSDLVRINGFNEDYHSPGIGEDSDVQWRMEKSGMVTINIKFLALQYHLFHQRQYEVSERNLKLFEETKACESYRTVNGLTQHIK